MNGKRKRTFRRHTEEEKQEIKLNKIYHIEQMFQYILNNYKILLIKRNNYDIDELLERYKEYNDNIIVSDIEMRVLSSTYIRDCLKNSVDVSSDIHPKVLKYILDKGLYR